MSTRNHKPRDFVALFRNLTEDMKKSRLTQMKWFQKYELLLKEYEKLHHEITELYKERTVGVKDDIVVERERTCLPIPITSNGEYGWLAAKSEFRLEKYGSCIANYPDPSKGIIFIRGDVPRLAAGKGFI
ncbi:uncharacterized protein [Linepithema humile]|uniref:uncharacterized protein n=1 Tax=Linepithema humile TaxID=83485 RepID=UPI00351F1B33